MTPPHTPPTTSNAVRPDTPPAGGAFADRLIDAVRAHGPLCVGIDPHPALIPALFGNAGPQAARAWGEALVRLCAGRVAVVKPQAGLFERWGSAGLAALEHVCRTARSAGLLVLLDAKRGDIGSTAEGYVAGYLAPGAPCEADAITVNPYLGLDTIEPFVAAATSAGKGVAVLARTSNPGAADFQALEAAGEPVHLHVAHALAPMIERLRGPRTGWSGLMLVAGATGPREAIRLRQAAPKALFLVPGYGAQGASARDAVAGFVAGPEGVEGGVVNASRAVASPAGAMDARTASQWEAVVASALAKAQAELAAAVGSRA
ncbi:orotidine-5'-phosphate decarboxylase [bacterium]|nr:orotidine-5'-phosphate decarboxylase [bacterium]